ncbi:hypothetical protein C8R46DRAFT_1218506 [Mycena filopes]|nr:hypothetical protein C8R46DRAFT_1218506 [Mycena filopes]
MIAPRDARTTVVHKWRCARPELTALVQALTALRQVQPTRPALVSRHLYLNISPCDAPVDVADAVVSALAFIHIRVAPPAASPSPSLIVLPSVDDSSLPYSALSPV